MPGCCTSNFDRSFCVGSPARLLEETLQVLCAGRSSSEDEDVVAPPFVHREPFFDLPVRSSIVASGGGATRASSRANRCWPDEIGKHVQAV